MSQTSLGMGSGLDDEPGSGIQVNRLVPEGSTSSADPFYDFVAYVIYCEQHQKVGLTRAMNGQNVRSIWFPFVALPTIKKWKTAIFEGLELILNKTESQLGYHQKEQPQAVKLTIKSQKYLKVYRLEIPGSHKFITRIIYLVTLGSNPEQKCCEDTKRLFWYPLSDIIEGKVDKLWGPEVLEYVKSCKDPNSKKRVAGEYPLEKAYNYVVNKQKSIENKVIKSTNINERTVEILYSDFLEFCFPSFFMNIHSFREYLLKLELQSDPKSLQMLFNAFDQRRRGHISFNEFLLGLAAWDPTSCHEEFRVMFVFRFYDIDGDGFLDGSEFKRLVKDIAPKETEEQIQQRINSGFNEIGVTDNKISKKSFLTSVGLLKFRKTSHLCRCPQRIVNKIVASMSSRSQMRLNLVKGPLLKAKRPGKGICNQCRAKSYELDPYGVFLDTMGKCGNPFVSKDTSDLDPNYTYLSEFTFKNNSIANIFMELIRDFSPKKGSTETTKGFLCEPDQRQSFAHHLQQFANDLSHIFAAEERLIRINSPAYVIGDLLGNIDNLLAMESVLWKRFPVVSANYVFLGNYVEFGKWGVETVVYLLSLKMIEPNKIFLLRGRHEIRDSQKSFRKECIDKYDEHYGKKIWQIINSLFDKMPIALTIDENIFCANSGIPNTKTKVKDYVKISANIKDPAKESEDVMQLLFNEPIEKITKDMNPIYGFVKNPNLGTTFAFDESAFKSFLQRNGLTHMIAANKPTPEGYKFMFGTKLINIFSNSKFKDLDNKSVALLVFKQTIRVLQLDISDSSVISNSTEDDTKTVVKA